MRMALLGASGYIGRSLLHECTSRGFMDVVPFTRDAQKTTSVWERYGVAVTFPPREYKRFHEETFDIVVNATGVGSQRALRHDPTGVVRTTMEMDERLYRYMDEYPHTRVFNLGSGAVYGANAGSAIVNETSATFFPNRLSARDCYALAKLLSEAHHRALSSRAIVDLRVFSFFSRFVDIEDTFFLSEVAACLRQRRVLKTSAEDMMRDFTTAREILDVILFLCTRDPVNAAFNLESKAPASKFEILSHLSKTFGLRYEVEKGIGQGSPTGTKHAYYSMTGTLSALGFPSRESSLEAIDREMRMFLNSKAPLS